MTIKRERLEQSSATLRDLMTAPVPSPELRSAIFARRRTVRELLEDHRDRLALEIMGKVGGI